MFQNESKENQIRKAVEDILKRKEFQQTDERNNCGYDPANLGQLP